MRTYRTSEMALVHAPEVVVNIKWDRLATPVSLRLDEVGKFVKANGLQKDIIRHSDVDGGKAGIFPCVGAKSVKAALNLSAIVGYAVEPGDGVSFFTPKRARDVAKSLLDLGIELDELILDWRIGKVGPKPTQQFVGVPQPAEDDLPPF